MRGQAVGPKILNKRKARRYSGKALVITKIKRTNEAIQYRTMVASLMRYLGATLRNIGRKSGWEERKALKMIECFDLPKWIEKGFALWSIRELHGRMKIAVNQAKIMAAVAI